MCIYIPYSVMRPQKFKPNMNQLFSFELLLYMKIVS